MLCLEHGALRFILIISQRSAQCPSVVIGFLPYLGRTFGELGLCLNGFGTLLIFLRGNEEDALSHVLEYWGPSSKRKLGKIYCKDPRQANRPEGRPLRWPRYRPVRRASFPMWRVISSPQRPLCAVRSRTRPIVLPSSALLTLLLCSGVGLLS